MIILITVILAFVVIFGKCRDSVYGHDYHQNMYNFKFKMVFFVYTFVAHLFIGHVKFYDNNDTYIQSCCPASTMCLLTCNKHVA